MAIEVIRVLKYTYETPERMVRDMKGWTHHVHTPPGQFGSMTMESHNFIPTIKEDINNESEVRPEQRG